MRRGLGRQDLADAAEGYTPITTPPPALEDDPAQAAVLSANSWRDSIANAMHEQYKDHLQGLTDLDAQEINEGFEDAAAINAILDTNDISLEFQTASAFFTQA